MTDWNLKGKKALITGASDGIGKAINEEFLALGAETIIVARREDKLKEISAASAQKDQRCHYVVADLGTADGCLAVLKKVMEKWPQLEVLVNNVGMNIRKPTLDFELSDLQEIMRVNVESAFVLSQKLHDWLRKANGASIVNISSITSYNVVQTSTAAYHMSKGALDQLTRFLAVEWGQDNIRCNAIHPWYIATPLAEQILKDEKKKARIVSATPLGRVGQPEEVARVAAFLAMDVSSYMSGAHLTVDGGFSKAGLSFLVDEKD